MGINQQIKTLLTAFIVLFSTLSYAVPVLQLGPDDETDAIYNVATETWEYSDDDSSFSFNAYNLGKKDLTAYLVLAAESDELTDSFDVSVKDSNGVSLSLFSEGYGNPPFGDIKGLPSHGIYGTWSEVYEIVFDGQLVTVPDTQPGGGGSASGYLETIFVDLQSSDASLTGIHVDMFTTDYNAKKGKYIVTGFAPFSHDGEMIVSAIPVPATVWLFGSGLLALAGIARRRT